MAKHDQRILKFLTQNAERTPTITDMMTRLNISISDITASLNSLMAQGLVSKQTNTQGIECWFPAADAMPQVAAEPIDEAKVPSNPPPPASAFTGSDIFANQARPQAPDFDSDVFTTAPAAMASASTDSSMPTSEPAPMGQPTPMNGALEPTRRGVGWLPFLVGLIVTGSTAVYVSRLLMHGDIAESSQRMVEKSEMEAAAASWTDFEASTQSKLLDLETRVKDLSGQLAAMKTQNDSLRALDSNRAVAGKKGTASSRRTPVRKRR